MEAAIQTNGLLSLPSNPQTRRFLPNKIVHRRFLASKTVKSLASSSSVPPNGPPQNPCPKANHFLRNHRSLVPCRVETAAAADAPAYVEEPEKPKFLGIEILMLRKIVPLGLMFFCILFNYTILRDTKDVLIVTAKGSSAEIIPLSSRAVPIGTAGVEQERWEQGALAGNREWWGDRQGFRSCGERSELWRLTVVNDRSCDNGEDQS